MRNVSQELPLLAIPLAGAATAASGSLIRSGKHHVSDVFAGSVIGLGVAYIVWKSWPPGAAPRVRWPQAGPARPRAVPDSRFPF
ncbi:MAG: hypothetical protein DLM61_17975 [Pseudonocardiales bacterium]|nr:MAG: hypothetical protein DLM61_17975 [Pseudonocardiales bacterium]